MRHPQARAFVIDLGGVLFTGYKDRTAGCVDLSEIWHHPIWQDLEMGKIELPCALTQLSVELQIPSDQLEVAIERAYDALTLNGPMLDFIRARKAEGCRIVCLTNTPREFFRRLVSDFDIWDVFDEIFVSALLGLRKPDPRVWSWVTELGGLSTHEVILVDDDADNIRSARTFGWRALHYGEDAGRGDVGRGDVGRLEQSLDDGVNGVPVEMTARHGVPGDAVDPVAAQLWAVQGAIESARGRLIERLQGQRRTFCYTSQTVDMENPEGFPAEIFSTLCILQSCRSLPTSVIDPLLTSVTEHGPEGRYCFFTATREEYVDPGKQAFPADLDTTALANLLLLERGSRRPSELRHLIPEILHNADEKGVLRVYFDPDRPRVDAVVCANGLRLLSTLGCRKTAEIDATLAYLESFLSSGAWRQGTRYYPSPDAVLYFLAKLVTESVWPTADLVSSLRPALIERIGATLRPMDLAMRVVAAACLETANRTDLAGLLAQQLSDGGWPMEGFFVAGKSGLYFGSREMVTALALEAMELMVGPTTSSMVDRHSAPVIPESLRALSRVSGFAVPHPTTSDIGWNGSTLRRPSQAGRATRP